MYYTRILTADFHFLSGTTQKFRVKDNPNSNVHRSLDVAEGLVYLHSQGIIHGGLKAVSEWAPCLGWQYLMPFDRATF